jgi:hypothetical protein
MNCSPRVKRILRPQLRTSEVCNTDLLWCVRFNPLFVRGFIRSFVLVGRVVIVLSFVS